MKIKTNKPARSTRIERLLKSNSHLDNREIDRIAYRVVQILKEEGLAK